MDRCWQMQTATAPLPRVLSVCPVHLTPRLWLSRWSRSTHLWQKVLRVRLQTELPRVCKLHVACKKITYAQQRFCCTCQSLEDYGNPKKQTKNKQTNKQTQHALKHTPIIVKSMSVESVPPWSGYVQYNERWRQHPRRRERSNRRGDVRQLFVVQEQADLGTAPRLRCDTTGRLMIN